MGRDIKRSLYNSYTSVVSGLMSMVSPARAAMFRYGRDMYRTYSAGSTKDADMLFRPRLTSADNDIKRGYKLVAARCRDEAQNNPLIAGAIRRICNNVVRSGILPKFQVRDKNGKLDARANAEWRALYLRWTRYCDIRGKLRRGAMQKLELRHMWTDGQYLLHRVYDDSKPGIVPLRLELLEFDQLDSLVDGDLPNGNIARRGVELDRRTGKPLAYHILDHHPGDYLATGSRTTSQRIPASEIKHVWDQERISQWSGISWMAAVVMESYRMDDFRHITQDAARLQASFHGFLKSAFPGFGIGAGIGFGGQASPYKPADTGASEAPKEFKGGVIQPLPSGTDMVYTSPTHPGANFEPFVKDSQRHQSSGFGMSFEAYANNHTDSSFSSSLSSSLEERLSYRGQQQLLDEESNSTVIAWFIEAAYLAGLNPSPMPNYARDPDYYHEMADSQFPGWGSLNANNDANAAEKLIDLTLDTRRNQAAQRGYDWDALFDESMDEEEKLVKLAELRAKRKALEENNGSTSTTIS